MNRQKNTVLKWIHTHKKELITTVISIAVLITIIIGIKKQATLKSYWMSLKQLVEKTTPTDKVATYSSVTKKSVSVISTNASSDTIVPFTKSPHHVCEHIRTLPNGYNASLEKIKVAKDKGIALLPGQTFVNAYTTGGIVA